MERVARKIAPAKWEEKEYLPEGAISADALGGCLRSHGDTLSFWVCTDAEASLHDVVLAFASRFDKPEKMHLVVLDSEDLTGNGLTIEETEGETNVEDLKDRHRDLVRLSIDDLCTVAWLIAPKVRADEDCHVFTKAEVLDILRDAIAADRLAPDALSVKVRAALESTKKRNS